MPFRKFHISHSILASIILVTLVSQKATAGSAPWVGETFWGAHCRGKAVGYGPFDYLQRASYSKELYLVESAHFTPAVENLVKGNTGKFMGDLDYTLRAWPNHHRALNSVIQYRLRVGNDFPRSTWVPAECYLQRAISFNPKDTTVYMLYGLLLHRMERREEALEYYRKAEQLDSSNVQLMYNLGLLLCDLGEYQEAKEYSDKVYASGFPLPGLKNKLTKAGH